MIAIISTSLYFLRSYKWVTFVRGGLYPGGCTYPWAIVWRGNVRTAAYVRLKFYGSHFTAEILLVSKLYVCLRRLARSYGGVGSAETQPMITSMDANDRSPLWRRHAGPKRTHCSGGRRWFLTCSLRSAVVILNERLMIMIYRYSYLGQYIYRRQWAQLNVLSCYSK